MRFIKSFFSSDPREEARTKLLELEIGTKAIELPVAINLDDFRIVVEVAEELIKEEQLHGRLIGRKGWFLPDAQKKLEESWKQLKHGKLNLKVIADQWGINEKRVFIALEEYGQEQGLSEPIFYRSDLDIWLNAFLHKKYIDVLSSFDFDEEEVAFSLLVDKVSLQDDTREAFKAMAIEWFKDKKSSYVKGEDEMVRRRDMLPELIQTIIPQWFEEGKKEVTYEDIATKFGLSEEQAGEMLQKLVDERALGDVTLYPLDQKLKPRL